MAKENRRMIGSGITTSPTLEKLKRCLDTVSKGIDTGRIGEFGQLLYTWIIPHCDGFGHFEALPQALKLKVIPSSDRSLDEFSQAIIGMVEVGLIILYEDYKYLEILKFEKHQTWRSDRKIPQDYPLRTPENTCKTLPKYTSGIPLTTNDNPGIPLTTAGESIPGFGMSMSGFLLDKDKDKDKVSKEKKEPPISPLKKSKDNGVKFTPQQSIRFDLFWDVYQNKQNKLKAMKAFKTLDPNDDLTKTIIMNVKVRNKSDPQWIKNNGEFIPLPSTYINDKRWHDILTPSKKEARYDF